MPNPADTFVWPKLFVPQAVSEPSDNKARLCIAPAATAVTLLNPNGGLAWPASLRPQPATVPSPSNARLCSVPPATARAFVKVAGIEVWPKLLTPHARTGLPVVKIFSAPNATVAALLTTSRK